MREDRILLAARPAKLLSRGRGTGVVSVSRDGAWTPSPEELIRLVGAIAAHQDRQAFAALFKYFGPRLKTFFMRGGASPGTAEDLVQETMLSLWRKSALFDPARAGVATWVFTVARNLRIDHLRREGRPAPLSLDPDQPPQSSEDIVLDAERDRRVRNALAGLSQEQMAIIRLSFYGDKSQSEIAGELGIPLGTVKSRARLAMNRLRALLDDET